MLRFNYLVITIALMILILLCYLFKKKLNKSNLDLSFFCVFYVYLMFLLKYTIFPIPIFSYMAEVMREETTFFANTNFIPFNFSSEYIFSIQGWGNIILTMPFGFGISFLISVKKKIINYALMVGVIIELLQLLISSFLGFTYRTIDINDVIFNFIGVMLGYYIFKLFSSVLVRFIESQNLKLDSLSNYIYQIAKDNYN